MTGSEYDTVFDRAYFEGVGSNYVFGYRWLRPKLFWSRRLRLVRDLLPAGRLLDVGCAFGYFLCHLDGRYEACGFDLSRYAVEYARRTVPPPTIIRTGDVERGVPFGGPFDLITAFDLFEHLARPEAALRHVNRMLRPGGYLILELPTIVPLINRDDSHCYRSLAEWSALLQAEGLTMVRVRGFWTVGFRLVTIPADRWANYHQIVAQRPTDADREETPRSKPAPG